MTRLTAADLDRAVALVSARGLDRGHRRDVLALIAEVRALTAERDEHEAESERLREVVDALHSEGRDGFTISILPGKMIITGPTGREQDIAERAAAFHRAHECVANDLRAKRIMAERDEATARAEAAEARVVALESVVKGAASVLASAHRAHKPDRYHHQSVRAAHDLLTAALEAHDGQ